MRGGGGRGARRPVAPAAALGRGQPATAARARPAACWSARSRGAARPTSWRSPASSSSRRCSRRRSSPRLVTIPLPRPADWTVPASRSSSATGSACSCSRWPGCARRGRGGSRSSGRATRGALFLSHWLVVVPVALLRIAVRPRGPPGSCRRPRSARRPMRDAPAAELVIRGTVVVAAAGRRASRRPRRSGSPTGGSWPSAAGTTSPHRRRRARASSTPAMPPSSRDCTTSTSTSLAWRAHGGGAASTTRVDGRRGRAAPAERAAARHAGRRLDHRPRLEGGPACRARRRARCKRRWGIGWPS